MGDGWSQTQGCDKEEKEDELCTTKGIIFYKFYNPGTSQMELFF